MAFSQHRFGGRAATASRLCSAFFVILCIAGVSQIGCSGDDVPHFVPSSIVVYSSPEPASDAFAFSILNPTDCPINVSRVESSCGCQSVTGPIGIVPPGGKAHFTGVINTSGLGEKASTVTLTVDGQPMVFSIRTLPAEGWYWSQAQLDFGRVDPGGTRVRKTRLVCVYGDSNPPLGPPAIDVGDDIGGQWEFAYERIDGSLTASSGVVEWDLAVQWTASDVAAESVVGSFQLLVRDGRSSARLYVRAGLMPMIEAKRGVVSISGPSSSAARIEFVSRIEGVEDAAWFDFLGVRTEILVERSSESGVLRCEVPVAVFSGSRGVCLAAVVFITAQGEEVSVPVRFLVGAD